MNELSKNKLKYVSFNNDNYNQILESIKDDKQLLDFISLNPKGTRVVTYDNEVIGFCSTSGISIVEIQYAILKEHRHQGLGSFLLNELTNEAFKDNAMMTKLLIEPTNESSIKTASSCGYYRDYDNEEFNIDNKEDRYYTYIKKNYNYSRGNR